MLIRLHEAGPGAWRGGREAAELMRYTAVKYRPSSTPGGRARFVGNVRDPTTQSSGSRGGNCAAGYDPCVPSYPPDVDCADVDGPVRVTGDDPHALDRDGDGRACEP